MKPSMGAAVRLHRNAVRDRPDSLSAFKRNACPLSAESAISAKGDPLEMIDRVVPFESFRAEIEAAVLTPVDEKRSNAGRKRIDVIVMFRMLVLQSLYNFSDEQAEYHVHDRMSFTRFLRLGFEDSIPDATTLWLFRETLAKAGLIERLFVRFGHHLEAKGYIARGGQMVDATIVPVPK